MGGAFSEPRPATHSMPVSYALLDEGYCEGYLAMSTYTRIAKHLLKWGVRLGAGDRARYGAWGVSPLDMNIHYVQPLFLFTHDEFERITQGLLEVEQIVPWLNHDTLDSSAVDALGSAQVEATLRNFVDEGVRIAGAAGDLPSRADNGDSAALPRFSQVFYGALFLAPLDGHRIALLAETRSDHIESLLTAYDPSRVRLYEDRPNLFSFIPT